MQSIVDTTFIFAIATLLPFSIMYLAHVVAKRYRPEKGLLEFRYALITFVFGFFLYFFGTGLYLSLWTSTMNDLPMLMIDELIGIGFAICIMAMCHGACVMGGPSVSI